MSTAADDIPADLREYAQRLLMSVPAPGGADAVGFGREHDEEREDDEDGDGGVLTGCREAVEILTRNPKKGACVPLCCVRRLMDLQRRTT